MFGTLYVTGHEREALDFGVAGAEGEHETLRRRISLPSRFRLADAHCAAPAAVALQTRYA